MSEMGEVLGAITEMSASIGKEMGEVKTNVAVLTQRFDDLKMPVQPCAEVTRTKEDLGIHLEVHDETRKFAKRGFIGGTIGLLFLTIGTYITLRIKGVI